MAEKLLKIPFDSLTLSAVVWELQQFQDGKIQKISQPDEYTVGIELYSKPDETGGGVGMLLLSCHPQFARAYLSTKRLPNQPQPPAFCSALRSRLTNGRIGSIGQINFDRILEIEIEHPSGTHRIIAELMGKHSNLILVGPDGRVVSAAKWVGQSKSSRPIQAGVKYSLPPFPEKPPLIAAKPGDDLREFTGLSPFLAKLLDASPTSWEDLRACVLEGRTEPALAPGQGAYPISVEALGIKAFRRSSISVALEQHFDAAIPAHEAESLRANLLGQLQRVILAREVALDDLRQAEDAGNRAGQMQLQGELILAYGGSLPSGSSEVIAQDYEGQELRIALDPGSDFKDNANRYFDKAKRAKARMSLVKDQIARLSADKEAIESLAARVESAEKLRDLRALEEEAREGKWLHKQPPPTRTKEERPYQGHRVRELIGPGGWTILYGENAESNDYLTLRVAKPNDWWLHVRGHTSAHVLIQTGNQPEKVSREALEYAARVAVQHSPTKHSGYVPVDYTLKKYVRRQHGAPKGAALYTHEKTIHVES